MTVQRRKLRSRNATVRAATPISAHTARNLDPSPEPPSPPCDLLGRWPLGSPTATLWAGSSYLTTSSEAEPLLQPTFLPEIPLTGVPPQRVLPGLGPG